MSRGRGLRAIGGGALAAAVLLCALPAQGDLPEVSGQVTDALTQIDATPSKSTLNDMFPTPQAALDNLTQIATTTDPTVDHGVQLRAIRALPAYCPAAPAPCGTSPVHQTLLLLVADYGDSPHAPQDIMRLRAAAEALGATRSQLDGDVAALTPLLEDKSRDVRATVVRALGNVCNRTALVPLSNRYQNEETEQVRRAIRTAVGDLQQCP
jgi:hypothetical protein